MMSGHCMVAKRSTLANPIVFRFFFSKLLFCPPLLYNYVARFNFCRLFYAYAVSVLVVSSCLLQIAIDFANKVVYNETFHGSRLLLACCTCLYRLFFVVHIYSLWLINCLLVDVVALDITQGATSTEGQKLLMLLLPVYF